MAQNPYESRQRVQWLASLDAALHTLADQRPLAEISGLLVDQVLDAFDTPHAYLFIGAGEDVPVLADSRGTWTDQLPLDLHDEVCRTGEATTVPGQEEGVSGPVIVAPVRWKDEVVGTLGIGFAAKNPMLDRPDLQDLVARFATVVTVAYSNSRLVDIERRGRREQEALLRAGQALSATLQLREVLSSILLELRNVVPYDTASVQELRDDRMVIVGGQGIDMDVFGGHGFDVRSDGVPNADVLRTRAPVIVPDILGEHPYWAFPHDAHEMSGVRGWLGVPLMFGRDCIGMLTLDTYQPDFYRESHARTALAFAAQAAIALQNARSFDRTRLEVEERRKAEADLRSANAILKQRMAEIEALQENLREQAIRDPLTGLFNRRYLMDTLQREIQRCRVDREPLSVALIDVDHFKVVNDTLGHEAGDQILVRVGHYLAGQVRVGDGAACRYGGEEFVVVLPGINVEQAAKRAEEWRSDLQDMPVLRGHDGAAVTISVGVASVSSELATSHVLVRAADEAMYQAKRLGRNRVVSAQES